MWDMTSLWFVKSFLFTGDILNFGILYSLNLLFWVLSALRLACVMNLFSKYLSLFLTKLSIPFMADGI